MIGKLILKASIALLFIINFSAAYDHVGYFHEKEPSNKKSSLFAAHLPNYIETDSSQTVVSEMNVFHYLSTLFGYQIKQDKSYTGIRFKTFLQPIKSIVIVKTNKYETDEKPIATFKRFDFMVPYPFNLIFTDQKTILNHLNHNTLAGFQDSESVDFNVHVVCQQNDENIYALLKSLQSKFGDDYILLVERNNREQPEYINTNIVQQNVGEDCVLCFPYIFQLLEYQEDQNYKHFMQGCYNLQKYSEEASGARITLTCNDIIPSNLAKKELMTNSKDVIDVNSTSALLFNLNTHAEYDENYSSHIMIQISVIVVLFIVVLFSALLLTNIKSSDDSILDKPIFDDKKKLE